MNRFFHYSISGQDVLHDARSKFVRVVFCHCEQDGLRFGTGHVGSSESVMMAASVSCQPLVESSLGGLSSDPSVA